VGHHDAETVQGYRLDDESEREDEREERDVEGKRDIANRCSPGDESGNAEDDRTRG
jgi:hypothetical protein